MWKIYVYETLSVATALKRKWDLKNLIYERGAIVK